MTSYRKKPVEIEAHKLSNEETVSDWPMWLSDRLETGDVGLNEDGSINIRTLEGTMRGEVGDWIIQGVKGEIYPCKPDIFEATYDKVENDQTA